MRKPGADWRWEPRTAEQSAAGRAESGEQGSVAGALLSLGRSLTSPLLLRAAWPTRRSVPSGDLALGAAAWPSAHWLVAHPAGSAQARTPGAPSAAPASVHAVPTRQSSCAEAPRASFALQSPIAAMVASSARPAVLAMTGLALLLLLCLGPGEWPMPT
jgi:hypothetical protein